MNWLRGLLGRVHVALWNRSQGDPQTLAEHIHYWDYCRTYGFLRYRICLNGCGQKKAC